MSEFRLGLSVTSAQAVERFELTQDRIGLRAEVEQARHFVDADPGELIQDKSARIGGADQRTAIYEFII